MRAWWEVPAERRLDAANGPDWREDLPAFQAWCRKRTREGKYWVPFAKGGEYSPYYADIHLVVNWKDEGEEICNFADPKTGKTYSRPQNVEYYFRPGITWPARTTSGFSPYALPAGIIFSHKGPAAFVPVTEIGVSLAVMLSTVWGILIDVFMAGGEETRSGTASRSYEVGIVQILPLIELEEKDAKGVGANLSRTLSGVQQATADTEPSRCMWLRPALFGALNDSTGNAYNSEPAAIEESLERIWRVNRLIWQSTGLTGSTIESHDELAPLVHGAKSRLPFDDLEKLYCGDVQLAIAAALSGAGNRREDAVKSYHVSRKLEVLCRYYGCGIGELVKEIGARGLVPNDASAARATSIMSVVFGSCMGCWDIRPLLGETLISKLPDPFAPSPLCPPATLLGPDGLPATSGNIVSDEWLAARPDAATLPPAGSVKSPTIPDSEYPIEIPWNGILIDDPDHSQDIVLRMRKALEAIWREKSYSVEQEACQAVGAKDLREYLRAPSGFFQDHLSRYSKSRRKAPIYWPLSTASGSYTLWIYYSRLSQSTLFDCVSNYLVPKLESVRKELEALRVRLQGKADANDRARFEELTALERELEGMRQELLRVANLGYKPDLDDGVVICACPLHSLFRLPKWRKELEEKWEELQSGKYDWAHLAMAMWPDRVEAACAGDRSIAIAHSRIDLYPSHAGPEAKPPRRKKK